jgi:DNA-directed RNA polymerase specialized sigma24 family protein
VARSSDFDPATRAGFPATRASAVVGARSSDAEVRRAAFDALAAAYWRPAYAHLRLKRRASAEDAADLVQGFFAKALEKGWFDAFDPAKARFRTFFRVCLDGYAANEAQAAGRLKRGGGATVVGFDFADEEGEVGRVEPAAPDAVERAVDEAWARGLFAAALARLRAESDAKGRADAFKIFERHDVDPPAEGRPTYDALAAAFGLKNSDVINRLALMRREFRRHALDVLRDVTATDDEFRDEARVALGLDLP